MRRTLQNGRLLKFICSGYVLFQQHTAMLSETRDSETQLTAESSKSHQVFPRGTHRIQEFQHEAAKLVDTQIPSTKPTLMPKGQGAENQAFSFIKMRPQAKLTLSSSPSSFVNCLMPQTTKRTEIRQTRYNRNLCRNNNITDYHNYLNFNKEESNRRAFHSGRC